MVSLESNSRPRENYVAFLSDHGNYFQRSMKEKQFGFRGLIADLDFNGEFDVYSKEAIEITAHANATLLLPALEEPTILSTLAELDKLQSGLREETERLLDCKRIVNKTTSQYITELDYEAAAVKEEADAKIRAQEEIVNPKIANLNKQYQRKIKDVTESFDKELEKLKKLKTKTIKSIASNEGKIKRYQREAKAQATKNHAIYEKRWKKKIKQTQKELNSLKKDLKNMEDNIKRLNNQKTQETARLNFGFNAEIKFARQPLLELEAIRDAKMLAFKQETEKLLKQEKPVIEDLNKSLAVNEATKANFEVLGTRDQGLKSSALFYVPFYVACYEMGLIKRYTILPPSTLSPIDFSAKLKGAFGMSKIKDLLVPRFKAITTIIENVQALIKQNPFFETQLKDLSQKNNLLNDSLFIENVSRGLAHLKVDGWLSEKERQVLSNRLTA